MADKVKTDLLLYTPYKCTFSNEVNLELREFLNFLSIAYKANKVFEENEEFSFNWNELMNDELIIRLLKYYSDRIDIPNSTLPDKMDISRFVDNKQTVVSYSKNTKNFCNLQLVLKNKLLKILDEGIFDSILSYLVPNKDVINRNSEKHVSVENHSFPGYIKFKKKDKKKKESGNDLLGKISSISDNEVEIHVYDEVKGLKRDFMCSQSLLISSMGYFAEVTKGQKLEEMDISVHCDIAIFDWLMKWIRKDTRSIENGPNLDSRNVVPIMVSANFLQMWPLLQDCLIFCKKHVNDVVRYSPNLTCLNDNILKRFANMLSNLEIQSIKDKTDKIKSKLFCKLIVILNEAMPENHHGHYGSLCYLYLCLNCSKLVSHMTAPYVSCQFRHINIKYDGEIMFNHTRDPKWDLNEHIKRTWMETKSWSKTYWRLWSQCHFLYCSTCRTMYALEFSDYCPYHPQQPHFYPMEPCSSTNLTMGRYPCCGSKAVRYETIINSSGCKLRAHSPKLKTSTDTSIQKIVDTYPELIKRIPMGGNKENPISSNYNPDIMENVQLKREYKKETQLFRLLTETRDNGLLSGSWNNLYTKQLQKYKVIGQHWKSWRKCATVGTKEEPENVECCSIGESENSDVSSVKEFQNIQPMASSNDPLLTKPSNEIRPVWSSKYSIRHNQDNQRDYEEIAFKVMSDILLENEEVESIPYQMGNKKLASNSRVNSSGSLYANLT